MDEADSSRWFRTDQHRELLDTAEFTLEYAARLPDIAAWRWVIVGSVLVLQGACICGLSGHDTSGTNVLKNSQRKKHLEWLRNPADPPPPKDLPGPAALFLRVCDPDELPPDKVIKCTEAQRKDIERLIELRNQFAHFLPQGWSLEVAGLPRMIAASWDVTRQLCVERPTFEHRVEPSWRERIAGCEEYIRRKMAAISVDG